MGRSGSNVKRKNLIAILTICIISFFMLFTSESVMAAGFVNHNDSIYTQTAPEETTAEGTEETTTGQTYNGEFDQEEEPSAAEKVIGGLLYGVANGIHSALEKIQLDIDTIILGRLSYDNNNPALLRFEFSKGNVYGILSMLIYSTLRAIIYILLAVMCCFMVVKYMFKNTSRGRETFKSEFVGLLSMFVVLGIMPYFWDLAIFFRDVLLSVIRDELTEAIGIKGLSLWDTLSYAYEQSGGAIVPAALCLGTAFLTIMFIFAYALIVLTDILLCITFPFICIYGGERRKRAMENWTLMVITNLAIPIVDYVLIMTVASVSIICGNGLAVSIVQLFLAWNILKAREQMLVMLQLRSSQAGSLGGIMGMMAAGRLLRGATNNIKDIAGNIRDSYSDYKDASMEEDLDRLGKDDYEADKLEESRSYDEGMEDEAKNPYEDYEEDGIDSGEDEVLSRDESPRMENDGEVREDGLENDPDAANYDDLDNKDVNDDAVNDSADKDGIEPESNADKGENPDEPSAKDKINQLEADNDALAMENRQIDNQLDHDRDNVNKNNDEIEKLNDENERDQAKLDEMLASGEVNDEKQEKLKANIARRQGRIDKLQGRNEELSARISGLESQKMANLSKMRSNNEVIYETRGAMNVAGSNGARFTNRYNPSTATPEEKRMHEIIMKRVDIRNFDSPKFEGMLSHKEMSDFYKKRARRNITKAGTKTVMSGVGATMGAATMSWMGPAYTAYGMSAGMSAGNYLGDASVEMGAGIYKGSKNLYRKIKNSIGSGKNQSRSVGCENYPNEQVEYLSNGSMGEKIPPVGIHYEPESVINMEGSFMEPGKDVKAAVERSKTAKTALKYAALDAVRKKQLMRSINLNVETAIRNNGITENEVPEYIMRRYSGGIEELSAKEQQKVRDFIDEAISNWNNR